jgi:hypothetical protein
MPPLIATIATGAHAFKECQLLLQTLEQWEPTAEVFVLTDTPTSRLLNATKSHIRFNVLVGLDAYTGLTRKDMEARNGVNYPTMWHEFMLEKATVMEHIFKKRPDEAKGSGVWFLDADICLLAPLPTIPVGTSRLALSPHYIRPADEGRFGHFNGGFVWMKEEDLLATWRKATLGSRFYEQAALEAVWESVPAENRVELPIQDNFGWWRYIQSVDAPPTIQGRFGFNRALVGCGLTYLGQPVRSLHTHWDESSEFNDWLRGRLEFLARAHPPAKTLVQALGRLFPKPGKR